MKTYPSLSFQAETKTITLFTVSALIAFLGGILTAKLSKRAVVINCLVVGSMVGMLTLIPSLLNGYAITRNGVIFLIVLLLATVTGGLYWEKRSNQSLTLPAVSNTQI